MNNNLWIKNPSVLFSNFDKVLPNFNDDVVNNSNKLARLSIYLIIIINFSSISNKFLSIPLLMLVLSYLMVPVEKFTQAKIKSRKCSKPTKNNPFMNYTIGDLINDPRRLPACKGKETKEEIKKLTDDTFKDPEDLFDRGYSFRQFYTMPVTTIVNDQKGFAEELYGTMGLCKSMGRDCLRYGDTKYSRARWLYCNSKAK